MDNLRRKENTESAGESAGFQARKIMLYFAGKKWYCSSVDMLTLKQMLKDEDLERISMVVSKVKIDLGFDKNGWGASVNLHLTGLNATHVGVVFKMPRMLDLASLIKITKSRTVLDLKDVMFDLYYKKGKPNPVCIISFLMQ